MREQVAAPGGLPAQTGPQSLGVERQQDETALTVKVPARRLLRLGGGREMYESVREIEGGAEVDARGARGVPVKAGQDLVDAGQASPPGGRRNSQRGSVSPLAGGS